MATLTAMPAVRAVYLSEEEVAPATTAVEGRHLLHGRPSQSTLLNVPENPFAALSDEDYMAAHRMTIEAAFTDAMEAVLTAKPAEPLPYITAYLARVHQQSASEALAGAYPTDDKYAPSADEAAVEAEVDSRAELKVLFDTLDANGDGKVSSKEWGAAISSNRYLATKYFGGATMAEIGAAFRRIDVDGSQDLTWDEFETAARSFCVAELFADAILSVEGKSSLQTLWAALDINGDGKVSSKEWGAAISSNKQLAQKYFGGATMAEIGAAFRRIDIDGSGDLSWDEFETAARSFTISQNLSAAIATPAGREELRGLFDTLDTNGDGRVSSKEWGAAVAKNRELAQKYFGGATMADIGAAFRRIDVDGSGDLTWDECTEAAIGYSVAQKLAESASRTATVGKQRL